MTELNQKRLYEHFKATGQKDNEEMMLKAYPHFKEEDSGKKEKNKKTE